MHEKNPAYKWKLKEIKKEEDFHLYLIELTSQSWRSSHEVENPIWTHLLKIIVPKEVKISSAFFFISKEGAFGCERIKEISPFILNWAKENATIVCELSLQPSKLVHFKDEKSLEIKDEHQIEDHLIAYTWDKYLKSGDKTWPLQIPLTKAVIKAFDCIKEFSKERLYSVVDEFVVMGLSKRGWISWLTAAFDSRVIGVIPMGIDLLNLRESFSHQLKVYGKWARVIKDYEEIDLMKWAFTEEFTNLLHLIEPYEYRHDLKLPKYIINSAGDEFFLPDSSHFYFNGLLEPKYLRYVPNCPHNLFESASALESASAFYQMIGEKKRLPKFKWFQKSCDQVQIKCEDFPIKVSLWYAENLERRDFRFYEIGPIWKKKPIELQKSGDYSIDLPYPHKGWGASFIELQYPSQKKTPLIFTTDVYITTKKEPLK